MFGKNAAAASEKKPLIISGGSGGDAAGWDYLGIVIGKINHIGQYEPDAALAKMEEAARERGADAVLDVRIVIAPGHGVLTTIAHGTAVKFHAG